MLQPSFAWGAYPYMMHRQDALRFDGFGVGADECVCVRRARARTGWRVGGEWWVWVWVCVCGGGWGVMHCAGPVGIVMCRRGMLQPSFAWERTPTLCTASTPLGNDGFGVCVCWLVFVCVAIPCVDA